VPIRRNGTRGWALGSRTALAVALWPAAANGAPFDLSWSAPDGCPSRQEMIEATQARLGESPSDVPPELLVQGTVRADDRGFVVTLAMKDASGEAVGERSVRVERQSCKEVAKPTSVVLAMMIAVARPRVAPEERADSEDLAEPDDLAEPEDLAEPPPATVPTPPTPPAAAARRAPPPSSSPPQSSLRLLLDAAAVGSRGVLPTVGVGFALRAMYAPSSIVFGVEASVEDGGAVRVGTGSVGFQLFGGSTRVGLTILRTARFELIPTVGARLAFIRSAPTGYRVVHDEIRATMLAGPGVLARLKITPSLFVALLPELEGVLFRDRFQIRRGDELFRVHRPSAFAARLSLGAGFEFP
jgi:hypothetical protein